MQEESVPDECLSQSRGDIFRRKGLGFYRNFEEILWNNELPDGNNLLPDGKNELPHGKNGLPDGRNELPHRKKLLPHGKNESLPRKNWLLILTKCLIEGDGFWIPSSRYLRQKCDAKSNTPARKKTTVCHSGIPNLYPCQAPEMAITPKQTTKTRVMRSLHSRQRAKNIASMQSELRRSRSAVIRNHVSDVFHSCDVH